MAFIFVIPSVNDSHARHRISEFIDKGYEVVVYGFGRSNRKTASDLPYQVHVLGVLTDASYMERIKLYYKEFKVLGKKHDPKKDVFYLCGLDIALFFHLINPSFKYIYEECDLTHTYTRLKTPLEWMDKWIIKKSLLTVITSEGFIKYHFKDKTPSNICLVENKLHPSILDYPVETKFFDKTNLSIGFVGAPRFKSVQSFIDIFCRTFPGFTFHIYGGPVPEEFEPLKKHTNCIFHGFFKNPDDLPGIYASIDLVLSTYDVEFDNVRYAEPNKLYESIYFETPIIVSTGTFLAEKVKRLGIGFEVDPLDEQSVVSFVKGLSQEKLSRCQEQARGLDKRDLVSINDHLFEWIEKVLQPS